MNYKNEHKDFQSYALTTTKNATASIGSKMGALLPFNVSGASLSALRTSVDQNPGACITVGAALGLASAHFFAPDVRYALPALSGGLTLGGLSSIVAERTPWLQGKLKTVATAAALGAAITGIFFLIAHDSTISQQADIAKQKNAAAAAEAAAQKSEAAAMEQWASAQNPPTTQKLMNEKGEVLSMDKLVSSPKAVANQEFCELTWTNPTTGKTTKALINTKCANVFAPK